MLYQLITVLSWSQLSHHQHSALACPNCRNNLNLLFHNICNHLHTSIALINDGNDSATGQYCFDLAEELINEECFDLLSLTSGKKCYNTLHDLCQQSTDSLEMLQNTIATAHLDQENYYHQIFCSMQLNIFSCFVSYLLNNNFLNELGQLIKVNSTSVKRVNNEEKVY